MTPLEIRIELLIVFSVIITIYWSSINLKAIISRKQTYSSGGFRGGGMRQKRERTHGHQQQCRGKRVDESGRWYGGKW